MTEIGNEFRSMDELLEDRFVTPPQLTPLGLDLASLSGGGAVPAQYEGKTQDGRDVYCRYRGGYLSVRVANARGDDVFKNGTCILEERIGPPLYGWLSLGQVCRYAGLTINGQRPSILNDTEMWKERYEDLGGATTFYSAYLNSTALTAGNFVDALLRKNRDVHVVCMKSDMNYNGVGGQLVSCAAHINSNFPIIIIDDRFEDGKLRKLNNDTRVEDLFPEAIVVQISFAGFKYPLHPYASDADQIAKRLGQSVSIAGQDINCLHTTFSFNSSFPAKDNGCRKRIQDLDSEINAWFPMRSLHCFNLSDGSRCPDKDQVIAMDPVIESWIKEDEIRWWNIASETNSLCQDFFGYRPA